MNFKDRFEFGLLRSLGMSCHPLTAVTEMIAEGNLSVHHLNQQRTLRNGQKVGGKLGERVFMEARRKKYKEIEVSLGQCS